MWNYEHEVILNSVPAAADCVLKNGKGEEVGFLIPREGNYYYKTADGNNAIVNVTYSKGNAGTPQKVTFADVTIADAKYLRFAFQIKCDAQTAEFANWAGTYTKPIIFEVKADAGKALAADIAKAADLAIPEGIALFDKATDGTYDGTATLTSPYFSVVKDSISVVGEEVPGACGCELQTTEGDAGITLTARVKPFGTYEELMGIRRDSMTNLRTPAEFPIKGQVYDQYTFDYDSERVLLGGMSAVSQAVKSRTHHVFWVPTGDTVFKSLLKDAAGTAITPNGTIDEDLRTFIEA